jgi:hypothetical protein
LPHQPQFTVAPEGWTLRVGGTTANAGSADARRTTPGDGRRCDAVGFGCDAIVAGTTLAAADDDRGFPQSMQKRDSSAFPRPQKAQEIKDSLRGVPPYDAPI